MADLVGSKSALRLFHKLSTKSERLSSKDSGVANAAIDTETGIQLLIVGHTLLYRHLAVTYVHEDDRAVEIGCSYGHCTAVFPCPALGVDHAPEKVEEARSKYPRCRFACGNVFGGDLSWLDSEATALFVDIGGGENYRDVMRALATCIPCMPALRLVVAKSIEVRNFLLRFKDAACTVAQDLMAISEHDEAEAANELAIEIRRRGGELPVSLVQVLHCGPRLRYLIGKKSLIPFLKRNAPSLQLVEVEDGPAELRLRIRAAPGEVPPPPLAAVCEARLELTKRVQRQLNNGLEWSFLAVFQRLERSLLKKFLAVASDPALYEQASDQSLDDRGVPSWSNEWRNSVAMRHFHSFLVASPDFIVVGDTAGEELRISDFRNLRVTWNGSASEAVSLIPEASSKETTGPRIVLQVLDGRWRAESENADVPEIQELILERAWLLSGGEVLEHLKSTVPRDANDVNNQPKSD